MLIFSLFLSGGETFACPGALLVSNLPRILNGKRSALRLFSFKDAQHEWVQVPLQVDPLDQDGRLIFFDNDDYHSSQIQASDVLLFRTEEFGGRSNQSNKVRPPCITNQVFELEDPVKHRFAYLVVCEGAPLVIQKSVPVTFDAELHALASPFYQYFFNKNNYMQFDRINFLSPQGNWQEVATDSRILIRADVKNFFTMTFDSMQIESNLEKSRVGPVGSLARLSFFLKILLFKIRMSLATDVGFFSDSGHIPMLINMPVNAYDYLKPKSGILYSWVTSAATQLVPNGLQLPMLDPELVKQGAGALAREGLKFCHEDDCRYRYTIELYGKRMSMTIVIKRSLVSKGFFPMFVDNVQRHQVMMGWDQETLGDQSRSGLYFEVSGLPAGEHPWDFWLKLAGSADAEESCPARINVSPIKNRI